MTSDSTSESSVHLVYRRHPNRSPTSHTAHTALALWYLGAESDAMKVAYAEQCTYQRPSFASPGVITKDNWTEHLGDAKFVLLSCSYDHGHSIQYLQVLQGVFSFLHH